MKIVVNNARIEKASYDSNIIIEGDDRAISISNCYDRVHFLSQIYPYFISYESLSDIDNILSGTSHNNLPAVLKFVKVLLDNDLLIKRK